MVTTKDIAITLISLGMVSATDFHLDGDNRLMYRDAYVCDDYFNDAAAEMICAEMGKSGATWGDISLPGSSRDFSMDNLRCPDGATRLDQCEHLTSHNCYNSEGVYLTCGNWERVNRAQCNVARTQYSGDRRDNPIFGGGGFIGTMTRAECMRECTQRTDQHGRPCVAIEMSTHSTNPNTRARCALAWGCDTTSGWSGGTTFIAPGFAVDTAGRLMYNDGYVCDDHFNDNAGRVACAEMGLRFVSWGDIALPGGSREFSMDDLRCPDGATTLGQCTHRTNHNCYNSEGVLLNCEAASFDIGSCDHLQVTDNGNCVGTRTYGNNHDCRITVLGDFTLEARSWSVEQHSSCAWDYLQTPNGQKYCTNSPNGVRVSTGQTMNWHTDYSVTRNGWKLCASRQCTVRLYQHDNFGGWHHTYDQGNFARVHNHDNMSSMTISDGCTATIYEHVSYGGWSVTLQAGRYTMGQLRALGFVNDRVSSLKVQAGEETISGEGRRLELDAPVEFKQLEPAADAPVPDMKA